MHELHNVDNQRRILHTCGFYIILAFSMVSDKLRYSQTLALLILLTNNKKIKLYACNS